jgi:hypothetical protein
MARCRFQLALAIAAAIGCGPTPTDPTTAGDALERLLPEAGALAGWAIDDGPTFHSPDTLFEYLDGGAPQYLAYGFQRMVHVRYALGGDPLASVTLDVFDMASELGAFGIYASGRPQAIAAQSWGSEGYCSGTVAAAWLGSIYVHAEADDDRPELLEMLRLLVAEVVTAAPGQPSRPAILEPLPSEGLVPHSERYVARDLLGHAFLPGGVLAAYQAGGSRGQLFYSDLGGDEAAADAIDRLRDHQVRLGTVDGEIAIIGDGGFRFTGPGLGAGVAVRAGRFVAGVYGDLGGETRQELLGRLVDNLVRSERRPPEGSTQRR